MLGPEFSNCWLKMGRALEHAKTLTDEITSWENAKPYRFTGGHESEGYFHYVKVRLNPVPDWDRWSLIFGDSIHNLRSALDHFIYAAAISQTGTSPPVDERKLQFPITNTAEGFAQQNSRIQSLTKELKASIEQVQPYNRGHQMLPPLLAVLRDFDDCDKHRLVKITSTWQDAKKVQIEPPTGHHCKSITIVDGEIQDSADILAFTIEPPSTAVKLKYETAFMVGVSHSAGPTGIMATAVKKLLNLLSEEVRTIIENIGSKV